MAPSVFTCSLPYAQKNKQTLKLERKRNRRTVQTNRARIRQHGDNSTAVRPVLNCRAIQHLRARGVKKNNWKETGCQTVECSRKIVATEAALDAPLQADQRCACVDEETAVLASETADDPLRVEDESKLGGPPATCSVQYQNAAGE